MYLIGVGPTPVVLCQPTMTEDVIYISTGRSSREKRYHTEMCRGAKKAKNVREVTRSEAELMDLEKCTFCAGEHTTDNYDNSFQKALKAAARGDD